MASNPDKLKQMVDKTNKKKEVKEIVDLLEALPIGQFMLLLQAMNIVTQKHFPKQQP